MRFELVQPGEYYEYFYNIVDDDGFKYGEIRYDKQGWRVPFLFRVYYLCDGDFINIANKITELNAATKADKLFGFL